MVAGVAGSDRVVCTLVCTALLGELPVAEEVQVSLWSCVVVAQTSCTASISVELDCCNLIARCTKT